MKRRLLISSLSILQRHPVRPRFRAVVISLLVLLAGCGTGQAGGVDRIYTTPELAQTLIDAGICPEDIQYLDEPEAPVGKAWCTDEEISISFSTYSSAADRVWDITGELLWGCGGENSYDEDNFWFYVFGEKFYVGPTYTFESYEVSAMEQVMDDIATATGGMAHTLICRDFNDKFWPLLESEASNEPDAETMLPLYSAILGEPGSDPSLLDRPK
jgi:hypothetical protein